jgi:calcineurin-like phosphoesterase family protein
MNMTQKGSSRVFFTSDLHFFHKNIVKFTNRGQETNEEDHNEWLINLWNSTVAKGDIVYHLGDLSFAKDASKTVDILNQLNGTIHLLKGNHDHSVNFVEYQSHKVFTHQYVEKQFKIGENKQHIVMFHFPIGSWHKQGHGSWHLHGHSHGNYKDTKGKMLDVGIDNAYNLYGKHCFFDLEMIEDYMQKQEVYTSDSHRVNI